jgi:serine/threonine protein kinase
VLYEMLSGRTPFEAATPEAYLGMHLHTPAPPLDTSKLPRDVGPELAAVVRKALQKNRDRRFRDAEEFRLALEAIEPAATAAEEKAAPLPPSGRRAARVWTGGVTAVLLLASRPRAYWIVHRPAPRAPAGDFPLPTAFPTPAAPLAPTESGLALPATSSATPTRSGAPARAIAGIEPRRRQPLRSRGRAGPDRSSRRDRAGGHAGPAEAGESLPDVPDRMDEEGARRFQRFLKRWRTLTPRGSRRKRGSWPASPTASWPRTPTTRSPASCGSACRERSDRGRGRSSKPGGPRIASRYYEAYRELDFAPRDAALDRLFAGVRPTPD